MSIYSIPEVIRNVDLELQKTHSDKITGNAEFFNFKKSKFTMRWESTRDMRKVDLYKIVMVDLNEYYEESHFLQTFDKNDFAEIAHKIESEAIIDLF